MTLRLFALALVAAMALAPATALASPVINGNFEERGAVLNSSPGNLRFEAKHWTVSNGTLFGATIRACETLPSTAMGLDCGSAGRNGNSVLQINPLGTGAPVHAEQTYTLDPGTYRFGGEFGIRVTGGNTFSSTLLQTYFAEYTSNAFIDIYRGTVTDANRLGRIDVSPQTFNLSAFNNGPPTGALYFAYTFMEDFADDFFIGETTDITLRMTVAPDLSPIPQYVRDAFPGTSSQDLAGMLRGLAFFADNVFIERSRVDLLPVSAPGSLGLAFAALAGMVLVRRRAF